MTSSTIILQYVQLANLDDAYGAFAVTEYLDLLDAHVDGLVCDNA